MLISDIEQQHRIPREQLPTTKTNLQPTLQQYQQNPPNQNIKTKRSDSTKLTIKKRQQSHKRIKISSLKLDSINSE